MRKSRIDINIRQINPYSYLVFTLLCSCSVLLPGQNLPYYLDAALHSNPVVQQNINLSYIARLDADKAQSLLNKPEITTTGNLLFAPLINGVGYDEAITNGALYSAQINANIPLFNQAQSKAYLVNSQIKQQIYRQNTQQSQHDLIRQVTEQYILTWQNLEQLVSIKEVLDLLNDQERLILALMQNGILLQSDVQLFQIEKAGRELTYKEYQTAYRKNLATLNLLCGIVDTSFTELSPPSIELQTVVPDTSNFLEPFRLDSVMAASDQEVFELKYRPQFSAFGNYGLNAIKLKDINKRFGFSAGLNFSLTISDGHQKELNCQQMVLYQLNSQNQKDYLSKQVKQQMLSARQEIRLLDEKLVAVQKQITDYDRLLAIYSQRLAQGDLSVNDYLNTIKSYVALKGDLTQMKSSRLLLINNYNFWNW